MSNCNFRKPSEHWKEIFFHRKCLPLNNAMSELQRNSPVSEPRSPSSTHTLPLPTKTTVTSQSPLHALRTEESFYLNHLIQWFSKILSEFSSNIQQINLTSWNHDSDQGVIISASPLKRKDQITFRCELLLDTCHNKTKYKQLWYNMKATSGISNHSCITVQLYLGQYHETLTEMWRTEGSPCRVL